MNRGGFEEGGLSGQRLSLTRRSPLARHRNAKPHTGRRPNEIQPKTGSSATGSLGEVKPSSCVHCVPCCSLVSARVLEDPATSIVTRTNEHENNSGRFGLPLLKMRIASCFYGKAFDTVPPQVGAGSLSFCRFSRFWDVFLGLPGGVPTLPALF